MTDQQSKFIRVISGPEQAQAKSNGDGPMIGIQQPDPESYPTNAARRIFEVLLPEWWELFQAKNAEYGEDPDPLGPAGEFVEIYRKSKKLRRALWDGEEIGAESPREVTMDMIGHCFLLLDLLDGAFDIRIMEPEESDGE